MRNIFLLLCGLVLFGTDALADSTSLVDQLNSSISELRIRKNTLEGATSKAKWQFKKAGGKPKLAKPETERFYKEAFRAHNSLIDQMILEVETKPASLRPEDFDSLREEADRTAQALTDYLGDVDDAHPAGVGSELVKILISAGAVDAVVKFVVDWYNKGLSEEDKKIILKSLSGLRLVDYRNL